MRFFWLGLLVIFLFPYSLIFRGPGLIGCLTLVISFLRSLVVGLTRSTWYGVRVWLVYIRGILVLFLFFCSLSPNPRFYSPQGAFMRVILFFIFSRRLLLERTTFCNYEFSGVEGLWDLQPFFLLEGSGSFIYCWMGAYLFFVIILVVKISPKIGGAVRASL